MKILLCIVDIVASAISSLPSFYVTTIIPVDGVHDVLEGVLSKSLFVLLKSLFGRKMCIFFTLVFLDYSSLILSTVYADGLYKLMFEMNSIF